MRAKFEVSVVSRFANSESIKVELQPVVNTSDENKEFWKYTPQGKLEMMISNPSAIEFFEVGKEYYLQFTKATI